jgi:glucokinase
VADDGKVIARRVFATRHERGGEDWARQTVAALREIGHKHRVGESQIDAVGIGAPGPLNARLGVLTNPMPNLPGWQGFPIGAVLQELTGRSAYLDNDANCAALAEHWVGAGRGVDDLIVLTLGTGIGSGVIAGGRLLHGSGGNAAELGHTSINFRGKRCVCRNRGCIELYASASALVRLYSRLLSRERRRALAEEEITARDVYRAARAADPAARRAFEQVGRYLGAAIANIVHAFNPRMVVLAGGMAGAGGLLLRPVREVVRQSIYPEHAEGLEIRASRLRGAAGLLGAARLALIGDRR